MSACARGRGRMYIHSAYSSSTGPASIHARWRRRCWWCACVHVKTFISSMYIHSGHMHARVHTQWSHACTCTLSSCVHMSSHEHMSSVSCLDACAHGYTSTRVHEYILYMSRGRMYMDSVHEHERACKYTSAC